VLPAALLITLGGGALRAEPEVYEKKRTPFTVNEKKVKGFEVRARETYSYPMPEVLDAAHDHRHLAELNRDPKLSEVTNAVSVRQISSIIFYELVADHYKPGTITYELDTDLTRQPDGSILIEWRKIGGAKEIKYLAGSLRVSPAGADGSGTLVDYHLAVAAPKVSADKLGKRADAYLNALANMLKVRAAGQPGLWVKRGGKRRS